MIPITVRENGELAISRCSCAAADMRIELQAAQPQPAPSQAEPVQKRKGSYTQILKSSAVVGGSQIANIAIGIIRTKAMAMLLGPSGFGLFGLYNSVSELTLSVAGMGINSSGVRQIAEAAGSGDKERIARTTAVLRRTSVFLGLLGAGLLLALSRPIAKFTFGNVERAAAVSLLSIAVLFRLVSSGQGALIQGMRRISDLAKMSVFGALLGTSIGIPIVYFLRERGVVPSLIGVAATTVLTSWYYSRKVKIEVPSVSFFQVRQEVFSLLRLGSAFMASGLMMMGSAYVVRVIIRRMVGFEATGLYQSAWTLGGLYVGFILQAMGADFYPRLTAQANDSQAGNRLVNEQAQIGLLLAGPGLLATLTFAPAVLALFYSAKFGAAVVLLRWISLGVMLRVITWPMGFIIIAKGRSGLFFLTELAWTTVTISLTWTFVKLFGLNGAGMAFFGAYVFHGFLVYPIVRRLTGFRWSTENIRTGALFLSMVAVVFAGFYLLPFVAACVIGTLAVICGATYALRALRGLVSLDQLPRPIQKVIGAFGMFCSAPATSN